MTDIIHEAFGCGGNMKSYGGGGGQHANLKIQSVMQEAADASSLSFSTLLEGDQRDDTYRRKAI